MGHELWTSALTGYRRTGTRVREIRAMFEREVTVRSIYEPLKSCLAQENADEMRKLLSQRGFDVAGVKEPDTDTITRFVTAAALSEGGTVDQYAQAIPIASLISDAAPLAEIFSILGSKEYAFVLVGDAIAGIITRADLNKPPARIYLFAIISLFEMHLTFWIRREFGNSWQNCLKQERLTEAAKLFEERRKRGQELDMCECIQFCDRRVILVGNENLSRLFAIKNPKHGEKIFRRIESLRNLLAHGQPNLDEDYSWKELSEVVRWMENGLMQSDTAVEEAAIKGGRDFEDKFWSPAL